MRDNFCATEVDSLGNLYFPMTVFVIQPYGEDEVVSITLTDGTQFMLETRGFIFPAGVGKHIVVVEVGDRTFRLIFNVYKCKGKLDG